MPPKKGKGKGEEEAKPMLGRFSSHLKIGIVGLPNVGKSTLFNTMTKCQVPAENFPFCTIEPNSARVNVPDERYNWLIETYKPKSKVPAFLEVVDIAGLVKGAAEGAGLGNAFLSNISAVDGIFHVLRAFDDTEVTHVEDRINPVEDIEIIAGELLAKDLARITAHLEDVSKKTRGGVKKEQEEEIAMCNKIKETLESGKEIRKQTWTGKEVDYLNTHGFLTAKPVVFLVNLSEKDYKRKKNKWLMKIHEWIQANSPGDVMIPYSGALESMLIDMPEDEGKAYLEENKLTSCLDKIVKTGFAAINLIYFFTAGPDEVKCWQIRQGCKAPQAAGTIHTDFEKGFICAEVMKYDELREAGTESAVKAAGKYRQEGKNYVVGDGDVIFFKFNVGKGK
ncbi:ribosome-binding ATPase YchF [Chloropicon primus]|uniref:Obg-like ATPase 1 n=1 Tax=Chloropicon primus TaxID=1764295 RepID=A0A5B8MMJ7_9CHLO|nr:ribosome-binding ATPase YchF [Chloropicon primus]UPR00478.1 ribosome-binding ATPase YchF [Chloropicon primus]|mmetsp:Transcript_12316/g.34263  ORF Transcript_12316/g.34263 Transcript_12316/m.34263 type:complete len:394 (+) Transcript_12316:111-1292(+)|eukprot:QDZ21264.1 ribosome-binding ATPase YchF [Chloropicon primus]